MANQINPFNRPGPDWRRSKEPTHIKPRTSPLTCKGPELLAHELVEGAVVVFRYADEYGLYRYMTPQVAEVGDKFVRFYAARFHQTFLVGRQPDGTLIDDLGTRVAVYEFLGETEEIKCLDCGAAASEDNPVAIYPGVPVVKLCRKCRDNREGEGIGMDGA